MSRLMLNKLYRYTITYTCILIFTLLVTYAFNINTEKQVINSSFTINILNDTGIVLANNTLLFLFIISAIYIGKINIYLFLITNGVRIGLLISKFMYVKYMLLILPHGVLEISTFLLLAAFISVKIDNGCKINTIGITGIKRIVLMYCLIVIAALIEVGITPQLVRMYLLNE